MTTTTFVSSHSTTFLLSSLRTTNRVHVFIDVTTNRCGGRRVSQHEESDP